MKQNLSLVNLKEDRKKMIIQQKRNTVKSFSNELTLRPKLKRLQTKSTESSSKILSFSKILSNIDVNSIIREVENENENRRDSESNESFSPKNIESPKRLSKVASMQRLEDEADSQQVITLSPIKSHERRQSLFPFKTSVMQSNFVLDMNNNDNSPITPSNGANSYNTNFTKKMSLFNVKDEKIQFKVAARFRPYNEVEEVLYIINIGLILSEYK